MKIAVIENITHRKQAKVNIVSALTVLLTVSCTNVKNSIRQVIPENEPGIFFTTEDSFKLFVYEYIPTPSYNSTVFIISGITGINHHAEKEVIELLANSKNRVVVIHPRGQKVNGETFPIFQILSTTMWRLSKMTQIINLVRIKFYFSVTACQQQFYWLWLINLKIWQMPF